MHSSEIPQQVDVAIIGAGIAGLGIALALEQSGLSVALFDKSTPATATSANSLRIIHGGFRYLQSLDVRRCFQSMRDQHRVLRRYPSQVRKLPCVLPLKPQSLRMPLPLIAASTLYSVLRATVTGSLQQAGRIHRENGEQLFPALRGYAPDGVFCWDDFLIEDPTELVRLITADLQTAGIRMFADHEFERSVEADAMHHMTFRTGNGHVQINARCVVNSGGPWVNTIAERISSTAPFPDVVWARAVNLVFRQQYDANYGIAFEGNNGAMYFMTPRGSHSVFGTIYTELTGELDSVRPSDREIAAFVSQLNKSMPQLRLSETDVMDIDVGVLPASEVRSGVPLVIGPERIVRQGRCLHVLSTKYTTFLSQGEAVSDMIYTILQ